MRILHVLQLYLPSKGGIERVAGDIVEGLREKGEAVDVLCCGTRVLQQPSYVYCCKTLFEFKSVHISIEFLKRWISIRNNYDIIHVHLPNPLATLWLLLFPARAKIVLHWHSDIVRQKWLKIIYNPLQRWVLNKAQSIIVTTPPYAYSSKDLVNHHGKLSVIPIGINSERLYVNSEIVAQLHERYKENYLVFSLGRHVYYKGFEWLIKAMKQLPDNYVLLLGGTGSLTNEIKQLVNSLHLSEHVVFTGLISDEELGAYYAACDVFCLPSIERSEAFGVVQIEAMSLGKPVVSTAIEGSGVAWVNRNDVSGRVVAPRNAKSLSEAIKKCCEQPIPQENIKKYFLDNFRASDMVQKISALYKKNIGTDSFL